MTDFQLRMRKQNLCIWCGAKTRSTQARECEECEKLSKRGTLNRRAHKRIGDVRS